MKRSATKGPPAPPCHERTSNPCSTVVAAATPPPSLGETGESGDRFRGFGANIPSPKVPSPTCPDDESHPGTFFLCAALGRRVGAGLPLLLLLVVQVLGQIAEDDLVEGLVADEVLAEDRLARLSSGLSKDGRRSRGRVTPLTARGR